MFAQFLFLDQPWLVGYKAFAGYLNDGEGPWGWRKVTFRRYATSKRTDKDQMTNLNIEITYYNQLENCYNY